MTDLLIQSPHNTDKEKETSRVTQPFSGLTLKDLVCRLSGLQFLLLVI